ncbi:MAG: HNH endonuclease signature motif containing protein [Armatimonadota bacterium]|nr:HNH endonuclease signature motif containing protein [Armatimonadota bacterium]MDR7450437.1 HNH endonuclease signature motif containing protein [Armatimonadota bacterium]MDR7466980.1 HNH endonuclease signature motif containing protein [Armatimonadota bacterium]MDR7493478.1 HNH endonuclease signature motif containing protein [Armatimonadota bacterium]MDR7498743.1 HNH endonuclease signature motif containing protein [Armatimonadota bacterium]
MIASILVQAAGLNDRDLTCRIQDLVRREREATAALIAHLAVFDERRLYLAEGCPSMFAYCTRVLHLSEYAAYNRIEAARVARRFPQVLDLLTSGAVNLTTVGLLAPHLTAENHVALLTEAERKTKHEVEALVARLRPQPPVASTVRRLPIPAAIARPVGAARDPKASEGDSIGEAHGEEKPGQEAAGQEAPDRPGALGAPLIDAPAEASRFSSPSSARRPVVEPLAPRLYRIQFTADEEMYQALRRAQDLLRHRIPDGDAGEVFRLALRALLKDLAQRRHSAAQRDTDGRRADGEPPPRQHTTNASVRSRHIPAEVRRAAWARDQGQCAYVSPGGRRCEARGFLEFHHIVPYARGGTATLDNIQLRCRAHNGYEAELIFGRDTVQAMRHKDMRRGPAAAPG